MDIDRNDDSHAYVNFEKIKDEAQRVIDAEVLKAHKISDTESGATFEPELNGLLKTKTKEDRIDSFGKLAKIERNFDEQGRVYFMGTTNHDGSNISELKDDYDNVGLAGKKPKIGVWIIKEKNGKLRKVTTDIIKIFQGTEDEVQSELELQDQWATYWIDWEGNGDTVWNEKKLAQNK